MKKVLFCSKYGLELKNSTGGQQLRIKTSIESLSKICDLKIISRNTRHEKCDKPKFLKNKNFLFAPSARKIISKNFLRFIVWRLREFYYLKQDAQFLIDLYKQDKCSCIWISYASQSYNLIKEIKKIDPSIKIISDTDSVFYSFIKRQIPYVNIFKKIYLYFYCRLYQKIEYEMLKHSDIVTAVSEFDAKIFKKLFPNSNIFIFRNAVSKKNIKKKNNKNFNILISGTFGAKTSPMNISTRWFLQDIYPLIKNEIKNLKIYIVGMNSDNEFKFSKKKDIIVKGWVKDITDYFELANLSVVPLKYESGTRFKILEAGLYKIPVISTTLGAEGLKYKKNVSIIIEDNATKFANKIIYLYHNKKIRDRLVQNNYKVIVSNYLTNILIKDGRKILRKI